MKQFLNFLLRFQAFRIVCPLLALTLCILLTSACDLLRPARTTTIPPIIAEPPPAVAFANLEALTGASVPERDLIDLAVRLGGHTAVPRTLAEPDIVMVGDLRPSWYENHHSNENEQNQARLAYHSDNLNLCFEESLRVDEGTLQEAATFIEGKIMPTYRAYFGSECRPGVDGDPRLNILHLDDIGGNVVGFFSAADEFVTLVNPFSNQREILYISLEQAPLGSDAYYEVIAHEMQHMIHWNLDGNEATWLDEGMAVLADDSDMTLTGRFDLRDLNQATLEFWSWFEIEEGWDDENHQGRWVLPLEKQSDEAILVISGNTPLTIHPAPYAYEAQP